MLEPVDELIFTSLLKVWAHLLHIGKTVPHPASSVTLGRAAASFGQVCWESRYDSHSVDMAYTQITLTDIRQQFLYSVSTNNGCAGGSENCRFVAIVCCEFINLWSKLNFASDDIRESSIWSSKPIQNSIWHRECYPSTGMKWNLMTAVCAVSNSANKPVCLDIILLTWSFSPSASVLVENGSYQSHLQSLSWRSDQQSLQMPDFFRE